MTEEDSVDIKFRLSDGTNIGPYRYSLASTVQMLKERILSEWPKGQVGIPKLTVPKLANEIKLIGFGRVLENDKTVGQFRQRIDELADSVMVLHVVVQPSQAKIKTEKKIEESRKFTCSCCIM